MLCYKSLPFLKNLHRTKFSQSKISDISVIYMLFTATVNLAEYGAPSPFSWAPKAEHLTLYFLAWEWLHIQRIRISSAPIGLNYSAYS